MEVQQQDEIPSRTEIEEPDQEEQIQASEEAISFMFNIGEASSVIWSLFYMFWCPVRYVP